MRREIRIFAHTQTIKQILNSKTEAHSNPLWIVGGAGQLREKRRMRREIRIFADTQSSK